MLFKDNKVKVPEWQSQSPDLSPVQNSWLKRASLAGSPSKLTEIELLVSYPRKNRRNVECQGVPVWLRPMHENRGFEGEMVQFCSISAVSLHRKFVFSKWKGIFLKKEEITEHFNRTSHLCFHISELKLVAFCVCSHVFSFSTFYFPFLIIQKQIHN